MTIFHRTHFLLLVALATFWTPTTARSDELTISSIRLGIADAAWVRGNQGLFERMFDDPRDRSASGFGLRYAVPITNGLQAGIDTGSVGDVARIGGGNSYGGYRAGWSAALLGAFLRYRYQESRTGLYGDAALGLDGLFTRLQLSGLLSSDDRRDTVALTSMRLGIGWSASRVLARKNSAWPAPILGIELGWSEIKPLHYGEIGTLNVGGWNSALNLGIEFGGLDRIWRPRSKSPNVPQESSAASSGRTSHVDQETAPLPTTTTVPAPVAP